MRYIRPLPRLLLAANLLAVSFAASAQAAQAPEAPPSRPPAVPLVTHDPYFSVWSFNNNLTEGATRHWTGSSQPMTSLLRVDGKTFRLMGNSPAELPALPQTSLAVEATHTRYTFAGSGVEVKLTFFTPAFPQDMALLSRPVTYLTWTARATDGKTHAVSVFLDVNPVIAVNADTDAVTWGRAHIGSPSGAAGLTVLSTGSRDQRVLDRRGDNLRIDWGYFHLGVPDGELASGSGAVVNATGGPHQFAASGALPVSDELDEPATPSSGAAHQEAMFSLGSVSDQPVSRHVLLAYTDGYSIEYLNQRLRPYWQRNSEPVVTMLEEADQQYAQLDEGGLKYDAELRNDLVSAGGPDYAGIAILSYRQALAAHKLTADIDGTPLLFAKENFSNGDIGTVDVLYPSAPIFLFFNPALLEAQVEPVLRYAMLPRWKFPFAPHDLGRWPIADGQDYGGGEQTEENQMPVEESGDLLILADALAHAQGNPHVAEKYWSLFTRWAAYLREKGLDPENQLSTDDFAGHLAHNANLSIKAIDALGAYADLARMLGKKSEAEDYRKTAETMAGQWEKMAIDDPADDTAHVNAHYKLAFDKAGTWSQKYNLVWDDLLGLHLFPPRIKETETRFYLAHMNRHGLPLDSRATYTKLDWEVWTATLAGSARGSSEQFELFMAPIWRWVNETTSRVPLTDWYDTMTGRQENFQARSVVGGVYIKALADESMAKKWRAMGSSSSH
jgi:hypothetical protein